MTILIPAYEPDTRLITLIEKIRAVCSFKIIVVDLKVLRRFFCTEQGSGYLPCFLQKGSINMKNERKMQFRHEYKHYINMADYIAIKRRLSFVARPDRHAGPNGKYRIRSLYFETLDDKNLREKLYGVNNREKFRIRYYNDDTTFIKLEKKTKVNGLGNKLSAPLTKAECERLIAGDIDWMRDTKYPLVLELYAKMKYQQLRPKTIVDYIREPFIYKTGNVRVTIDSAIQTGIHSKDLFCQDLPTIRTNAGNVIILEVKYNEFLPDVIRAIVQLKNRKSIAYSKYAVSRIFG